VVKNTTLIINGYDKVAVGDFAAKIRARRKPEPYKGKVKMRSCNVATYSHIVVTICRGCPSAGCKDQTAVGLLPARAVTALADVQAQHLECAAGCAVCGRVRPQEGGQAWQVDWGLSATVIRTVFAFAHNQQRMSEFQTVDEACLEFAQLMDSSCLTSDGAML
jgi:hypothetical protein